LNTQKKEKHKENRKAGETRIKSQAHRSFRKLFLCVKSEKNSITVRQNTAGKSKLISANKKLQKEQGRKKPETTFPAMCLHVFTEI
jgi:hypothetical protein